MVSKCANPECSAPFQYLHDGKLFEVQAARIGDRVDDPSKGKPAQKVEHFWLCGKCSTTMTLAVNRENEILILPKKPAIRRAVA